MCSSNTAIWFTHWRFLSYDMKQRRQRFQSSPGASMREARGLAAMILPFFPALVFTHPPRPT
jgi:hypothetical protein